MAGAGQVTNTFKYMHNNKLSVQCQKREIVSDLLSHLHVAFNPDSKPDLKSRVNHAF